MGSANRWTYQAGEHGRNRVTAYERPSGVIYLKFYPKNPETGERKRKRVSTGHRDRDKAIRQANELALRLATKTVEEDDSALTLRKLFHRHREKRGPRLSETRRSYYDQMQELFCRYLGPEREVKTLNREDWDGFIEDRRSGSIDARGREVADPEDRKPRSLNTVKKNLQALRALLNWGVGADLLETNPTEGYPLPTEENPPRPRVSPERYEAMLEVAGEVNWRFELALILAHETGHRIGAIRKLRWSDVDLTERLVRWRGDDDKSDYEHVTPLTENAVRALQTAQGERLAVGEAWIFPAPRDESQPCSKGTMRNWWLKAEELADLKHIDGLGWHGFRRKYADEHRDVPLKDLADLGGWKTPRTISEVYQGSDVEAMRRAQRRRRTATGESDSG